MSDGGEVELTTDQLEDILEASLNDFIEEKPKWHIRSKREASWAMQKLRRISNEKRLNDEIAEARIRELNESIAEEINEAKEWQRKENEKHARSITFFEYHLSAFHRAMFEEDPKLYKSYPLLDGSLSHRIGSYSIVVEDEEALLYWLANSEDDVAHLVQVKTQPDKTAIAKWIEKTGEIPGGIKRERSEDTFSVKPKVGE